MTVSSSGQKLQTDARATIFKLIVTFLVLHSDKPAPPFRWWVGQRHLAARGKSASGTEEWFNTFCNVCILIIKII